MSIINIGITPILTEMHALPESGIMIREKEICKISCFAYADDLAMMVTVTRYCTKWLIKPAKWKNGQDSS